MTGTSSWFWCNKESLARIGGIGSSCSEFDDICGGVDGKILFVLDNTDSLRFALLRIELVDVVVGVAVVVVVVVVVDDVDCWDK